MITFLAPTQIFKVSVLTEYGSACLLQDLFFYLILKAYLDLHFKNLIRPKLFQHLLNEHCSNVWTTLKNAFNVVLLAIPLTVETQQWIVFPPCLIKSLYR